MRIAYIDLVHKDPTLVERVSKRLTQGTNNTIFIHIDKKIEINNFSNIIESKNIRFIKNRVEVNWAGFSSIVATINSFKEALAYGDYDRFVIMQNLDYPLKSNEEINKFFKKNNKEYICAKKVTGLKPENHKYCLYWMLDGKGMFSWLCNTLCKVLTVLKINIKLRKDYILIHNKRFDIYQGCAPLSLTGMATKYIVDFYNDNPLFNKYFSSVFASDESYFHTILYNSNLFILNNENDRMLNLTYFEYPKLARIFYDYNDIKNIDLKNFYYIRKVTSEDSIKLLDYLDKKNIKK